MAKVSFSKSVSETPETPVSKEEKQVVDTPDSNVKIETQVGHTPAKEEPKEEACNAVAVPEQSGNALAAYDNPDDAVDTSELVFPSLMLMNALSQHVEEFGNGNFVIDNEVAVGKEIDLVVLWFFENRFVEKVDGGGQGEIASSEQEVEQLGGTVHWNESKNTGKPLFQKLATAVILVKAPEGVDNPIFSLTLEGGTPEENGNYALCKWNLKASAYTGCARRIKTVRKTGQLRECGYNGGWWKVKAIEKPTPNGKSTYWSPSPRFNKLTSSEFRTWVAEEVLGN